MLPVGNTPSAGAPIQPRPASQLQHRQHPYQHTHIHQQQLNMQPQLVAPRPNPQHRAPAPYTPQHRTSPLYAQPMYSQAGFAHYVAQPRTGGQIVPPVLDTDSTGSSGNGRSDTSRANSGGTFVYAGDGRGHSNCWGTGDTAGKKVRLKQPHQ